VMTRPLGWWKPVHDEAVRRGLIAEEQPPAEATGRRPLIRREWTAADAQGWSREDWIAIILSPLVYGAVLFGLTRMLLRQSSGLWLMLAAVAGSVAIYWVIDPKLRAVSIEYEEHQAGYAAELDRRMRWENDG
jgi:hypothetical protein